MLDIVFVLGIGPGKDSASVAHIRTEIEISFCRIRMKRSYDRSLIRTADRSGRQTLIRVCVVGIFPPCIVKSIAYFVAFILAQIEGIAGSDCRAQYFRFFETVYEYAGDLLGIFRISRFLPS